MPLNKDFKPDTGKEWPTVASGIYLSEIVDVDDLGEIDTKFGKKHTLSFRFKIEDQDVTLVKWVSTKWSPPGKYRPSNLYLLAEAALGERPREIIHPNDLIGKKLMLVVVLNTGADGNKRNQITDFSMIDNSERGFDKLKKTVEKTFAEEIEEAVEEQGATQPE